jgi:hypothetical protein
MPISLSLLNLLRDPSVEVRRGIRGRAGQRRKTDRLSMRLVINPC